MSALIVPDVITPVKSIDLMETLARQYFREFLGPPLSPASIALFTAQSALETGRWKAIHCYNVGNIKSGSLATYNGLVCQFRCSEIIGGEEEWFDPPHPQCNFRAYEDLDAGVLDYLQFLAGRTRYAIAWKAALRGEVHAFVRALAQAGYFTANAAAYEKAVVSLQAHYLAEYEHGPSLFASDPKVDAEWATLRNLVIASQFESPPDPVV